VSTVIDFPVLPYFEMTLFAVTMVTGFIYSNITLICGIFPREF